MPKIRPAGASLVDALKHLRVFQGRLDSSTQHQDYARKINEATLMISLVMKEFPLDIDNSEPFSDELIHSASILIQKEAIKNKPKPDYIGILKAMYTATNGTEILKLAKEYELTNEQLRRIAVRAPTGSYLARYMANNFGPKSVTRPIKPTAAIEPNDFEQDEEQITIDSDDEVLAQLR